MKPLSLNIGKDERGAIVGQTGTGKSVLAREILPCRSSLIIIDPKRGFDYEGVKTYEIAEKLVKDKPKRAIFRPHESIRDVLSELDEVYRYAFNLGNTFVYTDDLAGMITASTKLHWMRQCAMLGRSRNIAGLACIQRPIDVPKILLTESQKFYAFRVIQKDDVKRVQEFVPGYDPNLFPDRHTFMYYDTYGQMEEGRLTRLRFQE